MARSWEGLCPASWWISGERIGGSNGDSRVGYFTFIVYRDVIIPWLACIEVPMNNVSVLIDELVYKLTREESILWERKLQLWLRPQPSWCPDRLWKKLVNLVLLQTIQQLR